MLPPLILRNVRSYVTKRRPKLLGVYSSLPSDLFRIQSYEDVILRDFESQKAKNRTSFDVVLDSNGLVQPSTGGLLLHQIIGNFGDRSVMFKLPKRLKLGIHKLRLLWEHTDHYSIQTTVPIELDALNQRLSQLCLEHGEKMTKNEFKKNYPLQI